MQNQLRPVVEKSTAIFSLSTSHLSLRPVKTNNNLDREELFNYSIL